MDLKFASSEKKIAADDLYIHPFVIAGDEEVSSLLGSGAMGEEAALAAIESGSFAAKKEETLLLHTARGRVLLLGLGKGEELSQERLRRGYAAAVKWCREKNCTAIATSLPSISSLSKEEVARAITEGVALADYAFLRHKSCDKTKLLETLTLAAATKREKAVAERSMTIARSVHLARDLVNENADVVTPQYLSELARSFAKKYRSVTTTIFDKSRLVKEKMGLILAVSRGSPCDPALIIMKYRGNPRAEEHTLLVGKGVTYDTGGLNLKPTGSMETMRCDMGGAAALFGTIDAIASLALPVNVTAVIPATENGIDAASYKPGDIYVGFSGKSVEIANTDAEGRLILADALAYSCKKLKPTRIIDLATLTGAMVIALGSEATGLMSNDDTLAEQLAAAGESSYERVWRLPLYEEYKKLLKSDFADIKNSGGRGAGSITAALFLQEFVDKNLPWAHLDIAGTAFLSSCDGYRPKNGTGVGVRLLVDLLEQQRA